MRQLHGQIVYCQLVTGPADMHTETERVAQRACGGREAGQSNEGREQARDIRGNISHVSTRSSWKDEPTALAKSQKSCVNVVCVLLKCGFSRIYPTTMCPLRDDRDCNQGSKQGACWRYNPIHSTITSIKDFAIGIHPYYLPREI